MYWPWYWNYMCVLTWQISSIILTSFRQRGVIPLPPPFTTSKRTPKNPTQIQVKLKFGTWTNSNIKDSTVMFIFFCIWPNVLFFGLNLVQIVKNCWSWSLVNRLIWICRIRLWWSLFCITLFFANFTQKINFKFWCYQINLAAAYSQRPEASGFCFLLIYQFAKIFQNFTNFGQICKT